MKNPVTVLALSLLLAGCGGGSDSSGPDGGGPPGGNTSGFGAAVNLTTNTGYSEMPSVAISGTGATATVVVAWRDDVSGTPQVYVKRSTDGGATFGSVINLSNAATGYIPPSVRPAVVIAGTGATAIVIVAWHGETTNYEIWTARSVDGGATFGAPVNRSTNTGSSYYPALAISGTGATATVLLAWMGQPGNVTGEYSDILLKRSQDGGATFGTIVNLSNKPAPGGSSLSHPAVALVGGDITGTAVVAWEDDRSGNFEIMAARSTNTGGAWGTPLNLSNDAGSSFRPSVAIAGGGTTATVLVGWSGASATNRDNIYLKRSTDGGATYGSVVGISKNSTGDAYDPSVAIASPGDASSTALLAYEYGADIWLVRSANGGATFGAPIRLTTNSGFTLYPSVAISGSGTTETRAITWSDDNTSGKDIFFARSN